MFYSPSAQGFFDLAIHGADIPADAVEITREDHAALINGQSNDDGHSIVPGPDGRPMLQAGPKPTAHLAIDTERARRIEAGSAFAVPGMNSPVHLTGRAKDQSVYLALLIRAQGAKAAGIDAPFMTLRDGGDNILSLTPDQMLVLISQAMTWFESVMAVSWAMKDLTGAFEDGLPDDWRGDEYWP